MTEQKIVKIEVHPMSEDQPDDRHPLAPIILAALAIEPATFPEIVDAMPAPETLIVRVLGDVRPSTCEGHPFFLYSETRQLSDSEGPYTDLHYKIPVAVVLVLHKLQMTVQGVGSDETWQAVLAHISADGVLDDGVEQEVAKRLEKFMPPVFEHAERVSVLVRAAHQGGVQ